MSKGSRQLIRPKLERLCEKPGSPANHAANNLVSVKCKERSLIRSTSTSFPRNWTQHGGGTEHIYPRCLFQSSKLVLTFPGVLSESPHVLSSLGIHTFLANPLSVKTRDPVIANTFISMSDSSWAFSVPADWAKSAVWLPPSGCVGMAERRI